MGRRKVFRVRRVSGYSPVARHGFSSGTGAARLGIRLCLLLLMLAGCTGSGSPPEMLVRAQVQALQAAVEQGSLEGCLDSLHTKYLDAMHRNRNAAVRTLLGYVRRHREIHLFVHIDRIGLNESATRADLVAYVALSAVPVESLESLVALKLDLFRFDVVAVPDSDDVWRFATASWRRAQLSDLGIAGS